MNETQAVKALAALAHTTRLRVFRELVGAGPAGLHPGDLSQILACAPTALSFHLKELSQAGLVSSEREGRHLVYRAAFLHMNDVLAYLTAHCCQGQPCELTAATCASAIKSQDIPQG
jgi:DNA-binding transcriptional ArsR family regulator